MKPLSQNFLSSISESSGMTEKKMRISKSQWFEKALEFLKKGGINAVVIDQMAKELDVSKTGFYWHFQNKQELLEEMLAYWEYEYTLSLKQYLDNQTDLSPEDKLLFIMRHVRQDKLGRYDLAIAAWARTDPLAEEYFNRTIAIRHKVLKSIFKALGFKGNDLENRARLFVTYEAFSSICFHDDTDNKNTLLEKERLKLYMQKYNNIKQN